MNAEHDPRVADIVLGSFNEHGIRQGVPPRDVALIAKRLSQKFSIRINSDGKTSLEDLILTGEEVQKLNEFASQVAGSLDCKIIAIEGCQSCTNGSYGWRKCWYVRWGNLVQTTCGPQCWTCWVEQAYCVDDA